LAVKLADLSDNMDLSRLPSLTEKDFKRHEKYRKARDRLAAIAMEARQRRDGETRLDGEAATARAGTASPNLSPVSQESRVMASEPDTGAPRCGRLASGGKFKVKAAASLTMPEPSTELWDDECAICGHSRVRHTTNSGVGLCQIYPIFVSKHQMFDRLALARPTPDLGDDGELVASLLSAESARAQFERAREAMNAARPDPVHATRAERALYDERYQADNEAERAYRVAALELFTAGRITQAASRITELLAEIERLKGGGAAATLKSRASICASRS
jgi:hypothetical protein